MGVDHVQMAFVDGSVDRFADGAAGMVQSGVQIGQFDEVFKVRERRVAPVAAIPADERRAICRHEDRRVAANLHATRGVAGVLDELPRGAGDQLPAQAGRHAHPLPLDRRAGRPPKGQRLVVDKVDTDFRQDAVGVGLQQCQSFIAMHLVERKTAGEIGGRRRRGRPPRGLARLATAPRRCRGVYRCGAHGADPLPCVIQGMVVIACGFSLVKGRRFLARAGPAGDRRRLASLSWRPCRRVAPASALNKRPCIRRRRPGGRLSRRRVGRGPL